MALTNLATKRVDLPHEPGQWLTVRMPSLHILDDAKQAQARKAFQLMAGVDLSQLKGLNSDRPAQAGPDYDWLTLLRRCVTAWSYPEPLTPDNLAELDAETVQVVMAALLPAESEGDRKNA